MDILENIRAVLTAEADAIRAVPVTPAFERAVELLRGREGKVITTGMGKAGHAARKLAGTLCSTRVPAFFLHPGEAAHGDLGLVDQGDVLIAFSNSGRTREVLETVHLSRPLGVATVIAVTSNPASELAQAADVLLEMGEIVEPCPLELTPTASVAVMLAIGDALAITLLQLNGVTREDFGARHHGGYLGQRARDE